MQSFYRRPLPTSLVPFSSAEGRTLFREALADGTMEGYFPLAEQFHTQAEPAFCGLGALVMVLNALAIDPGRAWKGPWRWYSEELLDCCSSLDVVKRQGLTMGQLRCLARCNGADVESFPAGQSTLDELRGHVLAATRGADGPHVIVAYSRLTLGQTGDGHYSPIGGYHRERDLVLLLDVARFKYPPHWAPLGLLRDAMQPADPVTGRPRGYLMLRRGAHPDTSICRLTTEPEAFRAVASELVGALPEAIAEGRPDTVQGVMEAFFERLSPALFRRSRVAARAVPGDHGGDRTDTPVRGDPLRARRASLSPWLRRAALPGGERAPVRAGHAPRAGLSEGHLRSLATLARRPGRGAARARRAPGAGQGRGASPCSADDGAAGELLRAGVAAQLTRESPESSAAISHLEKAARGSKSRHVPAQPSIAGAGWSAQ